MSTLVGKAGQGKNFPAMHYADVPPYFAKLGESTETGGRLALMLVIATAARSGEVRSARWKHIDWNKAEWNRPAELMKSGKAHTVTLNAEALAVLRRAAAYSSSEDGEALIFPNRDGKPISDMTISKVMRRQAAVRAARVPQLVPRLGSRDDGAYPRCRC